MFLDGHNSIQSDLLAVVDGCNSKEDNMLLASSIAPLGLLFHLICVMRLGSRLVLNKILLEHYGNLIS